MDGPNSGAGAAQRPGRVVEVDGRGEGTGLVQRTGRDRAGAGEQASCLVAEELAQGAILRLPARLGRLRDARRHRARGDRQLARTAAAQRGLGNTRPVAALVTRVPRANARWCVPQRLRDGAAAGREHCVPRAVRALHCAIAFPPSLPIRCVGDNDDRSIRRGGACHRPRRAVRSSCSARDAIRAWRQTKPTNSSAVSSTSASGEGGHSGSKGLTTATPRPSKSATLRVATARLCAITVPAISSKRRSLCGAGPCSG